jgi:hypothetical protein
MHLRDWPDTALIPEFGIELFKWANEALAHCVDAHLDGKAFFVALDQIEDVFVDGGEARRNGLGLDVGRLRKIDLHSQIPTLI